MVGDDIEITVVHVDGDKVRLGISAPPEVSVHRKEVWEAIRRENRSAAWLIPFSLDARRILTGRTAPRVRQRSREPDAAVG